MDDEDGEDAEDENEDENEDGEYDEQGCRVAKSIESSKRKPPNAVIVSRQVETQYQKKTPPKWKPESA